jgi:hypothetical protein
MGGFREERNVGLFNHCPGPLSPLPLVREGIVASSVKQGEP